MHHVTIIFGPRRFDEVSFFTSFLPCHVRPVYLSEKVTV